MSNAALVAGVVEDKEGKQEIPDGVLEKATRKAYIGEFTGFSSFLSRIFPGPIFRWYTEPIEQSQDLRNFCFLRKEA